MKVLVTGGAGYIGSHLVDRLVGEAHDVTVLDDLSTGSMRNLEKSGASIHFVEGTILDHSLVERLVTESELVFHLAAAVGVGHIVADPLSSLITNTRGAENVIETCAATKTRLVLASTSEIYGKTTKMPMAEDDDRVLGSTNVHRWGYSTAKAIDEHLALAYADRGLPVSIVRYFNSFGPRLDPRGYGSVVANFMRQALDGEPLTVHGDGTQTRCFTFVDDTVDGTMRAGFRDEALGGVFNVGNDVETVIADLARMIIDLTGSKSTVELVSYEKRYGPRFEDTKRRVPSLVRAREVLGYSPTVALRDGLQRTLAWWQATHS
ncbi:MAG: NAD-dependent epimerase/dehydratase family protein [Ilumatobacteraceae bacterium]